MKSISRRALTLYALILLFLAGCGLLFYNLVTNADVWAMNRANQHLYSNGTLATAGDITDVNGEILVTTENGKQIFVTGHSEYDTETLKNEFLRDKDAGLDIKMPAHYFPNDDITKQPLNTWRSHANLLYSNWLNYFVYQTTPYDIETIE